MLAYLKDGSAQTSVSAATLRQKLQIQLSVLPSHSILTLGQPFPAPILRCQSPGRVAAGAPICKSLVWIAPENSRRRGKSNLWSLQADALTATPTRRWTKCASKATVNFLRVKARLSYVQHNSYVQNWLTFRPSLRPDWEGSPCLVFNPD